MPPNKMTALTVHLPFVGFTFTNSSRISDNPPVAGATGDSPESSEVTMMKTENHRLHREVDTLKRQLANKTIAESPIRTGDSERLVCMGQPPLIWRRSRQFYRSVNSKNCKSLLLMQNIISLMHMFMLYSNVNPCVLCYIDLILIPNVCS